MGVFSLRATHVAPSCGHSSPRHNQSVARVGRQRTAEGGTRDEAWRCGVSDGTGEVRVEVGEGVF
jgi:hypothetical protein